MEQKIDERLNTFIEERVKKVPVVLRSGFHKLCRTLIKEGAQWQRNSIWHDVKEPIEINRLIIFTRSGKVLPETGRYVGLGGDSHGDFFEILQKDLQHDLIYDMESWCYISDILPVKD